jgi:hypothetical protein
LQIGAGRAGKRIRRAGVAGHGGHGHVARIFAGFYSVRIQKRVPFLSGFVGFGIDRWPGICPNPTMRQGVPISGIFTCNCGLTVFSAGLARFPIRINHTQFPAPSVGGASRSH